MKFPRALYNLHHHLGASIPPRGMPLSSERGVFTTHGVAETFEQHTTFVSEDFNAVKL